MSLLLAKHNDGNVFEASDAADHGLVVGKRAVAAQGREIFNEGMNVVQAVRTVRMAGHLRLLPGRQICVRLFHLFLEFLLQTVDFMSDIDIFVFGEEL